MSQKKTKPRVKSAKADLTTENNSLLESPIRSSPATRALRFLLGKDPYPSTNETDEESDQTSVDKSENLISKPNDLISNQISSISNLPQSAINLISKPSETISNQINPISQVIEAPKVDLASIEKPRSDSEISAIASPSRASSNIDSSESQLQKQFTNNEKLTQSQLHLSQLTQSQLLASHQENLQEQTTPIENDLIIEIPLPSRPTPLGKREATPISLNWRSVEHTRIPQVVFDEILPQIPPMAQTPYLQLLRLTLGFQRSSCHISLESWAARCNQSLASIKRQAIILQQRGLLKKESVVFGGSARGSYFCPVIPGVLNDDSMPSQKPVLETKEKQSQLTQSQLSASRLTQSQLPVTYMKSDQIDHENKIDHHEKEVMMTYQNLTGNRPTLADLTSYRKIAYLGKETVIFYMQQIFERSLEPINSFAYFSKAVTKATQEQQRTRASQKRNLEKIVERVRQSHIGGRALISDLIEEIKRACIRDNVSYNNDLVNEILGI